MEKGKLKSKEYQCAKCGNAEYEHDEFRATGGMFSKLFDIQNKKFATISCKQCGYTEIYKNTTSSIENIADFLFGS